MLCDYGSMGIDLMPLRVTLRDRLAAADRALAESGMFRPSVAEICAGAGMDWTLIDMEHSPNSLESVMAQLHAVSGYPITPVVRVPINDWVIIKQVLDTGAQNILVPMVSTAEDARAAVSAMHYPPRGRRGVLGARSVGPVEPVDNYLQNAAEHVSLFVQIEPRRVGERRGDRRCRRCRRRFVGPSDLAASMGHLGSSPTPRSSRPSTTPSRR